MTPDSIKDLLSAVTPWDDALCTPSRPGHLNLTLIKWDNGDEAFVSATSADATLIAAAPSIIAWLLSERERLVGEVEDWRSNHAIGKHVQHAILAARQDTIRDVCAWLRQQGLVSEASEIERDMPPVQEETP